MKAQKNIREHLFKIIMFRHELNITVLALYFHISYMLCYNNTKTNIPIYFWANFHDFINDLQKKEDVLLPTMYAIKA